MARRPLLWFALLAAATACGTTVPYSTAAQQANNGGSLNNGLNAPVPGGVGASAGPLGTGSGPGVIGGGPGGVGPSAGPSVASACCQTLGTSVGSTRGITATTITLGFTYDPNGDAVNSAAGIGAITHGDDRANTRAIVKDINDHGGIAGRKIVPVFARLDSESTQTFDQQWAQVCQTFAHDQPVFAALTTPGSAAGDASYRQCLSRAGVPLITDFLPILGDSDFATDPTYVEMGSPTLDRIAAYQVTALQEQHYFTPWNTVTGQPAATGAVKVGVLTYSDPTFQHAVNTYLVPGLRRLGYNPVVEAVAELGNAGDIGTQAAAVKSAQLAFAANGVTHVIPFEANGGLSTFFMPTARSQNYFPRYGVSTASGAEALLEAGAADGSQFHGAVGFGWIPDLDLLSSDNSPTGPYSNPARRQCLKIMSGAGISFTSGNAEEIALASCAQLYLLRQALGTSFVSVTTSSLLSSVMALGTSYQPAGTVGVDFRPGGRRDVENKAYFWKYVDSCTCFRYYGGKVTIP